MLLRPLTSHAKQLSAKSRRSGFTLIELLLTLAVLVTVAAVAAVPLSKWQKAMPLDQSMAMLQRELLATRLLAIDEAQSYVVSFDANSDSFTRRRTFGGHDRPAQIFRLLKGISLVVPKNSSAKSQQLIFQPDGTVSDTVLILQDASGIQAALKIERLTGMVRVTDPSANAGGIGT